jgi:succinyl-diaminopimelate desuccinylase
MPDATVQRIQDWLRQHEQELLADTQAMLRIPSVKEDPLDGAPYGQANRDALDLALKLGQEWGMATKDIEHKVGYAEFGQGNRLVVSLGHLDVVPTGHGWKHEPFGAEIDEGYIYARGATDDKGPTMASFYAARAIKECCPDLDARIRVIFGCDEESGMACVERYVETEELPTFGIAPDSSYPLVHAEKGIADLFVEVDVPQADFQLTHCEGGQRLNIVIDRCEARVHVSDAIRKAIDEKLDGQWDRNILVQWSTPNELVIDAKGKAAHGSRPFSGDSAATRVFRLLAELAPLEVQKFYEELLWTTHPSGVGIGIHGRDEVSKDLTSNLGVVSMEGSTLKLAINVRYPTTWKGDQVRSQCENYFANKLKSGFRLADMHDSPSLYFPLEHPLVRHIVDAYREETGDMKEPGVMGGGTYARKISNTVSIGTGWEGDGVAHETDERLKVEHLFKMSRIYAHILYKLATVRD